MSIQDLPDIPSNSEPGDASAGRIVKDLIETLGLAIVIFISIRVLLRNFWIDGSSMEPNLHHGQYLLVARFSYWFQKPQRGQVIVFRSPISQERDLIKRVIGLPGEMVVVRGGQVLIDGQPLDEPYANPTPYNGGPWQLDENQVFVLGDNRSASMDSHNWGPLTLDRIIGKAWFCYWPPNLWGSIPHWGFN
ncbi:MAG: signal peptidase I [Anaerolineae bacterium]|nr:signal peptidase I [Anaerolineae bacterium]